MSPLSCLPAYFVFTRQNLDVQQCAERIAQYTADKANESQHSTVIVFLDQVFLHSVEQLQKHITSIVQVGHPHCLLLTC